MKLLQIFALLLLISYQAIGQEYSFFTNGTYRRASNIKTDFLRIYEKDGNHMIVKDYYRDTLNLRVKIFPIPEHDVIQLFMNYLRSKLPETEYQPAFASLKATLQSYNDGVIEEEMLYKDKQLFYYKVYDNNGNQVLDNNGNGMLIAKRKDEINYRIFKDSLETHDYTTRPIQGDTLYNKLDKRAAPKEGYQEFYRKMSSVIKYPLLSRMTGQEGTVYIQFVVDKDGSLSDFKCVNNESLPAFENKVMKKLSSLKKWDPAEFNGAKVKSCYVLPFTFELKN